MWTLFRNGEFQRKRALAKAGPSPMRDYLSLPLADLKQDWRATPIVALDLETTGLNPDRDSILSIGLVELSRGAIHLDTAWHEVVRVDAAIPESSAVIHQITDDQAAAGKPLTELLPEVLKRLAGKVMLVHYARIEQQFMDFACRRIYGLPFIIPIIDTLPIAQRRLELRNPTIRPSNLRLFNLRPLYGLPNYKAHDALYDALATAELFLAMVAEIAPSGKQQLRDLVR